MTQYLFRTAFLIATLSVGACSSTNSSGEINYRASEVTPTLEVPPDLIGKSAERNLDIPGSVVGKEENVGRFTETGYTGLERKVLPVFANMTIQGQGDMYWLEVKLPAEKLYPLIREYWAEQGFLLTVDEPSIGVMETEWLGLKSGSDSFISSFIASMQGAESKDQYITRLERSEDNNSTRVYLAHRGQELIISDIDDTARQYEFQHGWQFTPSDPAKEYEMVARLMVYLGFQQEQVGQEIKKIGQFAERAELKFKEEGELSHLEVKQGFEQTWNRFRHSLDRLSIPILDKEREGNKGAITFVSSDFLDRASIKVEGKPTDKLRIGLKGSSNSNYTRIDVLNKSGSIIYSPQSTQVLEFLHQQLK